MRFVPLKAVDQLDLQAVHRIRARLVSRRTGVINLLWAFLLETRRYAAHSTRASRAHPPLALEGRRRCRLAIHEQIVQDFRDEWRIVEERIQGLTRQLMGIARQDAVWQRLVEIPDLVH